MRIFVIICLPFVFLSCKERKSYIEKNENNGDNVYSVTLDDDDINNAIQKAKSTYSSFLNSFAEHDTSTHDYTVKLKFTYGENEAEHMWLVDLHEKKNKFYGVLDSDPVNINRIKWGDTIEIKKDSVSDWMYVKDDKMVGGYTVLALYNKMSEPERKAFREEISFELE